MGQHRRNRAAWTWLASALVLALGAAAAAQEAGIPAAKATADFLPEETMVLFEMRDVSATGKRLEQTALYKVFADPGVKEYLAPLTQAAAPLIAQMDMTLQQQMKVSLKDLGRLCNGRVAVALTGLNVGAERPSAKVVVLLAPRDPAHLKATLTAFLAAIPPDQAQRLIRRRFEGVEVTEVPGDTPVAWALVKNALVVGIGPSALDETITRMGAKPARRLAQDPNYRAALQRVKAYNQDWLLYVAVDRPVRMLRALAPQNVGRVMDYLGLEQMRSLTIAGKVQGDGIEDILYLHAPGTTSRLINLLKPKPVDLALLKRVPPDADSVFLGRCNLSTAFDLFMDGMKQLADPQDYQEFKKEYDAFEKEAGFSLEQDLFHALGDQIVGYSVPGALDDLKKALKAAPDMPAKMKLITEYGYGRMAYMVTVRDAARLTKALKALSDFALKKAREAGANDPDLADLALLDAQYKGVPYRSLRGLKDVALTPCYAVTDGVLLFSGKEEMLKKALDQMQPGTRDITTSALWAKAKPHIPEGAGMISFSEPAAGVEQGLLTAQNILQSMVQMGMPNPLVGQMANRDPAPLMAALKKHLFVPVMAVVADKDGITLRARSPYGGSSLVPAAAIVGIGGGLGAFFMMRSGMGPGMQAVPVPPPPANVRPMPAPAPGR